MANKKINQLVSKTAILSTDLFGIGDATTGQLFKKTIAELQAAIGGAVISVNGLVGTVVLDTDDIQELATPTNKYFTDARARGAISLTVTGNSGASTYSSGTGVLNVPTYTLAGLGGITASFLSGTSGISYNSTTGVITYSGTVYTDASIRALLSGGTGITYNSTTGAISYSGTVYTDSSVRALISMTTTGDSGASTYNNTTGVINVPNYTLAGLGGISYTSLSGGTGITYNNTTGAISYSGTVYTDASVRALISATGNISYNNTTGVISTSLTQYTDALARASVSLTTTGTSGASTYNSTTGVLNVPQYQSVLTNPVTGTGTTGYHAKWTSSSAIGNSAIFESGNNILLVANSVLGLNTADGSDSGYLALTGASVDGPTRGGTIYLSGNERADEAGSITIQAGTTTFGTSPNGVILLKTSATTRLTIASTGAATFSSTLNVANFLSLSAATTLVAPTSGKSLEMVYRLDGANDYAFIQAYDRTNSVMKRLDINGALTITGAGYLLLGTTSSYFGQAGRSNFEMNGSTDNMFVQKVGDALMNYIYSSSSQTEFYSLNKLRLSGGNVLINTSTDNGERLYVNGAIRATGTITANSDISLKKNLLKIENALEKVDQINGYTYEFKEDDSKRHAGVIAQEIQTVLPEIVNKGNDGILGVEYGNISALLIEAIKEQNIKIKNLETLLASK